MLRAGAAEIIITPPVGTFLEGYGARSSGSVGVHDDLHARAIVVDDGVTQAAVVACDLVGIDRHLAAKVRAIAHEATGVPEAHIMVSATHTHAGPAGLRTDVDPMLLEHTARLVAGAIIDAHGRMRPAVLKAGRGSVDTVSMNRREPAGPLDDALAVLLFDSPDPRDGAIASIVNFACHATVLFHTNMEISADYPGHVARTVKQIVGDAPVIFLNGACADVNPVWMQQSFAEAERVGTIVGAEAARRLQEMRPLGARQVAWNIRWDELTEKAVTTGELIDPRIRVASTHVEVPLRALDAPETYDARIADVRVELEAAGADVQRRRRAMEQMTMLQGTRGVAARLRGGGHRLRPEVQAIAFGDGCAILGLPGEFFAETGRTVREAAGLRHLLIACYTNHHVFYIVPRSAWGAGGYEPGVSVLDETADETFREAAVALLRDL